MSEVMNVAEIFGENVFNDTVMKERLPKERLQEAEKDHRGWQRTGSVHRRCGCASP